MPRVFGTIVSIFSKSDELQKEMQTKSIRFGNLNSFSSFRCFMTQYAKMVRFADKRSKIMVTIEPDSENKTSFIGKMKIDFKE